MNRKLCLSATLVALATFCLAQSGELPATIEKGRILTPDGLKIVFTHFEAGTNSYTYKSGPYDNPKALSADNVIHIQRQTGTEAGKWALWLGLSGLAGSLLGVLQVQNSYVNSPDVDYTPLVLGLTAGSGLIGAAIGSSKKKYETVYTNSQYGSNSIQPSFQAEFTCSGGRGLGVRMNLRF